MSYIGKKPSFNQVRTAELVVQRAADIATSGTIPALDVSNISLVRLTQASILQGIVAPTSPADNGKRITLVNARASLQPISIVNESTGATATNRISTGISRDMIITPGASVTLFYNTGSSRWSVESSSAEINIDRLNTDAEYFQLNSQDLSLNSAPYKGSIVELTAGSQTAIRSVLNGGFGDYIVLINKTGNIVTINNEDSGVSTPEYRILTGSGGPIVLQNNASLLLTYLVGSTQTRWQVIGGTGGGGVVEQVTQTGIGVIANYPIGTPLYVSASTGWTKANASASNTAEVAGILVRSLTSNLAEVALAGEVSGVTSGVFVEGVLPTKGSVVFLSTADGKLSVSDVTTVGYVSKPVGVVHNVNGVASVDIMFYNQRGVVVGSANARTQINLNGSVSVPTITPIQNISAYEAGELAGWINIDATVDYKFYFQTQFAKIPNTTNYNISVPQTVGSTPPSGFSVDVVAGVVQVTLPALVGFVSAYANFAINAPAVGTSLPLSVNSTSVYTTYRAVTSAYSVTTSDSLIVASGASIYAVTLPTAVGALGTTYIIKSAMDAGVNLTVNTTSSQLIDSVTSKTLASKEILKVVSDGTKWVVLTASTGFLLPVGAGTSSQFIKSNGDGTSSWTTAIYNTTQTGTSIDSSTGNSFVQNGTGSRTITVTNLADGQTININVQGANGNVISWTTTGLTQKTGITYSNTMTSINSIYTLVRLGTNVFISSLHGFG